MSKKTVHVLEPGTDKAACGVISVYANASVRSGVTCRKFKKTDAYKNLERGYKP